MTEFKVGDKVKCINNSFLGCLLNLTIDKEYTIIKIEGDRGIILFDDNNLGYIDCRRFELIERKIGDTWFKPEELYIHENALPLPRKFEFEAQVVINSIHNKYFDYISTIELAYNNRKYKNFSVLGVLDFNEKTKWKITMEEIIE